MKKHLFILSLVLVLSTILISCNQGEVAKSTPVPTETPVPEDITQSFDKLTALSKEFVDYLVKEEYSSLVEHFDKTMKEVFPEDQVEVAWKGIVKECGDFKKQTGVRTEKTEDYNIVFVTCEFEKSTIELKFVFNKDSQLSGFFCVPYQNPQVIEELTKKAKAFVELLVKEDYEKAVQDFDATMTSALPKDKLEEAWNGAISQYGSFKKQVGTRSEKYQEYDIIFVTCEFEKDPLDVQIVFDSEKKIAGLFFVRPQSKEFEPADYVNSDSFTEKEVQIGEGEWVLPGTLTLPKGKGPFPVILLVHGSGPNDRDETIGPNKPFKDLAWGLASLGIAVLRYEKRTKEHSLKMAAIAGELTVQEETIDDALAGVSLLRDTEAIDKDRIFVLGHSLGGMLIPRIGLQDKDISGFIVLAGAARPLEDLMLEQFNYIFSLDGKIDEKEKEDLEEITEQVEKVKDSDLSSDVSPEELPMGVPPAYWLDLRGYKPAKTAKELEKPLLILQGERDYQVTMEDYKLWQEALKDKENVIFKTYPALNHLFISGEGKSSPDEYSIPGHVSEEVIKDISGWIKKEK